MIISSRLKKWVLRRSLLVNPCPRSNPNNNCNSPNLHDKNRIHHFQILCLEVLRPEYAHNNKSRNVLPNTGFYSS